MSSKKQTRGYGKGSNDRTGVGETCECVRHHNSSSHPVQEPHVVRYGTKCFVK